MAISFLTAERSVFSLLKKKDLGGSPEVLFLSMKENTINKTRDRARN